MEEVVLNKIEEALTNPPPTREEELKALGYTILPAGQTRLIGVNQDWCQRKDKTGPQERVDCPCFVEDFGERHFWREVIVLGESRAVASDTPSHIDPCTHAIKSGRHVRMATEAAVAVK